MLDLHISDVVEATGALLLGGESHVSIQAVTTDSRQAVPGALFVCFCGERVDGNDYALGALSAKASVVMSREPEAELIELAATRGVALLRAADDDPVEFLLRLAEAWRRRNPKWAVVGVTGSVGKTTTKDFLSLALRSCWRTHATAGNFNNLIGVPLTLLSADAKDQVIVCEMGMNHAGELDRLTRVVRPTVALITNIGTAHIGFLGSRLGIARAKAEIVAGMESSLDAIPCAIGPVRPCLALTSDNDFGAMIEQTYCVPAGLEVMWVGTGAQDSVRRSPVRLSAEGLPTFEVSCSDGWSETLTLSVPGAAVVSDALLALALCWRLGADRSVCAKAIEGAQASHMRLEVVGGGNKPRVIDDSYNASPSSMAAALDVLADMPCRGRRIAVLGEMGELGSESLRLHGYVGAYVAAKAPDLVVWVGSENAARMREAALVMGLSEDHMESFSEGSSALAVIGPVLRADDLVLVKASRAACLDAFVKGVIG